MSFSEEENGFDGDNRSESDLQWSPFKQYKEGTQIVNRPLRVPDTCLDHDSIASVITAAFPKKEQESSGTIWKEGLVELQSNSTLKCLASHLLKDKSSLDERFEMNIPGSGTLAGVENLTESNDMQLWQTLFNNFFQNRKVDLFSLKWRKNFLSLLPIKYPMSSKHGAVNKVMDNFDKERCEVSSRPDPIYSGFASLRNGLYVSSNGIVFSSQEELQVFNDKMAEMERKLHLELNVIQDQHKKLKAQKAEEKKLLSYRAISQESDQDEEATESQQLNKENKPKGKSERKSGLFASLQASISAARSGFQGFWEKSSPTINRRSAAEPVPQDSGDSDDEVEKLKYCPNSKLPTSDGLDNHDEFTREMQAKGGLTYERADKTVQQLSHDALPPSLSLQSLQTTKTTK